MEVPVPRNYGPWKIVASHSIYRDPWVELDRDDVIRPDGLPGSHSVVRLKAGVCVLALDGEGYVHLTEEFHYALGRVGIEGVSGGIELDESPSQAARRELEEELGILAAKWTDLGTIDPFTTVVVSPTQLFLAEDLQFIAARREGTELIRPLRVDLAEALRMVESGAISHAPSCVLILRAVLRGKC
jgi:ADP-ribose pyrophosphatase